VLRNAFEPLVQLGRGLEQQEQAAAEQDQVAAGEILAPQGEQRRGQRHQPRDDGQQPQPHEEREAQADEPCLVALARRQLLREDRDEDEVVDAQHDLQDDQRQETEPDGRVGEQLDHDWRKEVRKRPRPGAARAIPATGDWGN